MSSKPNPPLATNLICRYRNHNAGHDLRVKILTAQPGRMYRVDLLESCPRFPKHQTLTVHETDLIADSETPN